ncbi:unnamed protein product [Vitrella brassicaformis CCMP3155]|uniref:Uncharacterized protein n=1 Tax=Vitrella brassicaformis (strain CCMP3155) TaxID=1169540 RepID=A0A0G4EBM7_VITBC|nr:unnamed protein product [Vitrella brassicaformis CCMP3155]|eukprot:CEL92695.1 unnamed protein product [Vitrella brassicaformis CCMP3155]
MNDAVEEEEPQPQPQGQPQGHDGAGGGGQQQQQQPGGVVQKTHGQYMELHEYMETMLVCQLAVHFPRRGQKVCQGSAHPKQRPVEKQYSLWLLPGQFRVTIPLDNDRISRLNAHRWAKMAVVCEKIRLIAIRWDKWLLLKALSSSDKIITVTHKHVSSPPYAALRLNEAKDGIVPWEAATTSKRGGPSRGRGRKGDGDEDICSKAKAIKRSGRRGEIMNETEAAHELTAGGQGRHTAGDVDGLGWGGVGRMGWFVRQGGGDLMVVRSTAPDLPQVKELLNHTIYTHEAALGKEAVLKEVDDMFERLQVPEGGPIDERVLVDALLDKMKRRRAIRFIVIEGMEKLPLPLLAQLAILR